ncbi:MAG: citrate lyase holo-[Clostridia bacterium]|nr:citrate lyase holo-[acyl-carrier protein] synthase [Clostridia bacterium]
MGAPFGANNSAAAVSVREMAARREERAAEQRTLLDRDGEGACIVCLNMNIAGPVKRSGLIDRAFIMAVSALENAFSELSGGLSSVREARFINRKTGIEALFALRADAEKVKERCVRIEEEHPLGRLLDIDVIAENGEKLSRIAPRKCLICGENAAVCARSRAHSVAELQKKTSGIIGAALAAEVTRLASDALLCEVHVTPKPGLVDEMNSGANPDMDIALFERSVDSLRPYFTGIAETVLAFAERLQDDANGEAGKALAAELRSLGIAAEQGMLRATGGVNTHRGAVYSMGLLAAAYIYNVVSAPLTAEDGPLSALFADDAENCARTAGKLAALLGDGSFPDSKGAAVRKRYGVGGAVEQAFAGFPLALLAKKAKLDYDDTVPCDGSDTLGWAYALLGIMAQLDDNNALRRGGEEGAAYVKTTAGELFAAAPALPRGELRRRLIGLDSALTEKNISCGGAADMLAAGIFLWEIEQEKYHACGLFEN